MRFLFLSILMIGVGVGVVGCEHDDDDSSTQEEEVVEEPSGGGRKYDLDFYGTVIRNAAAGPGGAVAGQQSDFIILGDDGVVYDPGDSLPEGFKVSRLEVWVLAKKLSEPTPYSVVIDIVEIRQR